MSHSYSHAEKLHNTPHTTEHDDGTRLQKLLAMAGYGSRRKCELLIQQGRVELDGTIITELGTKVKPHQTIRVDGSTIKINHTKTIVLAINKPKKVLSAMDDKKGRWTLTDIIGNQYTHIFHMGRLDYDSEGLILMTNNGELAEHIMHPRYEIQKTYAVTLKGHLTPETLHRMTTRGVCLDDGWQKFDKATLLTSTREYSTVRVTLHSGKNRIVRRMFAALGFTVIKLVRMKIGPISLGTIKSGSYRMLTNDEITTLKKEVAL